MKMVKAKPYTVYFSVLQFVNVAASITISAFLVVFLTQAGYTETEIGLLISVINFSSMVGEPHHRQLDAGGGQKEPGHQLRYGTEHWFTGKFGGGCCCGAYCQFVGNQQYFLCVCGICGMFHSGSVSSWGGRRRVSGKIG